MIRSRFLVYLIVAFIGIQLPVPGPALAKNEDDNNFLLLYFNEDDLFAESSTRVRKSVTRTAENVTIITAQEIKLMNAHTLAEVLNTVPGVQILLTGGPGSIAMATIQGSDKMHVAVFMDGVLLNNLGDNVTDVGSMPVQNIEKIEIIEGPASSAWGSALGGVINILTKSARGEEVSGTLSASYGRADSDDFRAEVSGQADRLGYYVTAGQLKTDGFRPRNYFRGNNSFVKLSYDITNSTQVMLSRTYEQLDRGVLELASLDYTTNKMARTRSTFSINSAVNREVAISLSAWQLEETYDYFFNMLSTGARIEMASYKDTREGASMKLNWKNDGHHLVLGTDLDAGKIRSARILNNEQTQRKQAYYINDTVTMGNVSVTPGFRRDETNSNGNMDSPSLGMTWKPVNVMLVRAYAARGFNIPPLTYTYGDNIVVLSNPDLRMERVRSYQAGVETTAVPWVWLKLDVFRHHVTDIIRVTTTPPLSTYNAGEARREGIEIEAKSLPIRGISLSAGGVFMNTRDLTTGITLKNIPQRTYDVGLHYDDPVLKLLLRGHYIYWNMDPVFQGKYEDMIFDLTAARVLSARGGKSLEAFLSIRNLFDGDQYAISFYKNPGRWMETGVRYLF